jgi:hypothetical protein
MKQRIESFGQRDQCELQGYSDKLSSEKHGWRETINIDYSSACLQGTQQVQSPGGGTHFFTQTSVAGAM